VPETAGVSGTTRAMDSAPRPLLTDSEQALWQELIESRCGLWFAENRLRNLCQGLWKRMLTLGLATYNEYYRHVAFSRQGGDEWQELLEVLSNKETSFFRHQPSFDALRLHVLPELLQAARERGSSQLALWSACCSTGQEAYSMAITLMEQPGCEGLVRKVTGSDLSPVALEKARRGVYREHETRHLTPARQKKYLRQESTQRGDLYHATDELRSLVSWRSLALHDASSYDVEAQDVIFCQNVLIYFRQEKRVEVVRNLCDCLSPGGYLFLAPAEVVGLKIPGIRSAHFTDAVGLRKSP
jgi:type IV pilus assembly protein PilK